MANVYEQTITMNDTALRASFQNALRELNALGAAVNVKNAESVAAWERHTQKVREWGSSIQAGEADMARLGNAVTSVETRMRTADNQMANATERMGRGLSMVARQGSLAGRSVNTIIAAGADLAFAFGPTGAIISAVLMVTAGVIEHFDKAGTAIEEMNAKFIHKLNELIANDDPVAAAKAAAAAYIAELEAYAKKAHDAEKVAQSANSPWYSVGKGFGAIPAAFRLRFGQDDEAINGAKGERAAGEEAARELRVIDANKTRLTQLKKERREANEDITTATVKLRELEGTGDKKEIARVQRELAEARQRLSVAQVESVNLEIDRDKRIAAIQAQLRAKGGVDNLTRIGALQNEKHSVTAGAELVVEQSDSEYERNRALSKAKPKKGAKPSHDAEHDKDALEAMVRARNDRLAELEDQRVEHMYMAMHLEGLAEQARIDASFNRQQREIHNMAATERAKIALMHISDAEKKRQIAETNKWETAALNGAAEEHTAQVQQLNAKLAAEKTKADEKEAARQKAVDDKQRRAAEASAHQIESVVRSSVDGLVRAHESLGRVLLKAMLAPEVKHLEGLAAKEFATAGAHAAYGDFGGAAMHAAAAGGYVLGAELVASIGAVGSGGKGGSSGGGSGHTGFPTGQQAAQSAAMGANGGVLKIEIVNVTKDQNGREISRIRQGIQRLNDRNQPIRVTL